MRRLLVSAALAAALALTASGLMAQNEYGPAQAYVVQKGDTAAGLARRFYGKPALGSKLWRANRGLVAHPDKLTVGDTIYIFPESTLNAGKTIAVPPPPLAEPVDLYKRDQLFQGSFPKYVSFMADGRGLGESGAVRVQTKRVDPKSGAVVDTLHEIRDVGYILASSYHTSLYRGGPAEKASSFGKTILSTNDNIIVQFTEDLAKILDSDTYGDADPYFREFPIYGVSGGNQGTDRSRVDRGRNLGELYNFKGLVTVVSRVEGLPPASPGDSRKLKSKKGAAGARGQDIDPVSYVGRITYSEDAIELNDRVFVFVPLEPGPERVLDAPLVEPPDSYVSLGD